MKPTKALTSPAMLKYFNSHSLGEPIGTMIKIQKIIEFFL